ncbi:MAG: hypothetical protein GF398_00910 [Chitinivibrionales bacterium]|nr:hypothetical protein [Chitinivibrionales bacterium]
MKLRSGILLLLLVAGVMPYHLHAWGIKRFTSSRNFTLEYSLKSPLTSTGTKPALVVIISQTGYVLAKNSEDLRKTVHTLLYDKIGTEPILITPHIAPAPRQGGLRSHRMAHPPSKETQALIELLDQIKSGGNIDPSRIYIIGFSDAEFGVYDILQRRPELFAAAIPIKGGGDPRMAERLQNIAIWAHHGQDDMVDALAKLGNEARHTEARAFDVWNIPEQLTRELTWMLKQKQASATALPEKEEILLLSDEHATVSIQEKEQFHLYLLIGQSNMAGRGRPHKIDKKIHSRILMLDKHNTWQFAREPLHFDRRYSGVGPGFAFARELVAREQDIVVGLIPSAVGETTIQDWQKNSRSMFKGQSLYAAALFRAKKAEKFGTIKGVLWHQGESNNYLGGLQNYEALLIKLINDIRIDLQQEDLPFILGEIAESSRSRSRGDCKLNLILQTIPHKVNHTRLVSSAGLSGGLHFDTPSYRVLGIRYAREMMKVHQSASLK